MSNFKVKSGRLIKLIESLNSYTSILSRLKKCMQPYRNNLDIFLNFKYSFSVSIFC